MWLALKVVFLPCSAWVCEHRWSIEDSIHSKRRNRLGQELVEGLVRIHTNLKLEQRLELYEAGMLPWDIEMTVEEPLSDDEDGIPQCVSNSESESENADVVATLLDSGLISDLSITNEKSETALDCAKAGQEAYIKNEFKGPKSFDGPRSFSFIDFTTRDGWPGWGVIIPRLEAASVETTQ